MNEDSPESNQAGKGITSNLALKDKTLEENLAELTEKMKFLIDRASEEEQVWPIKRVARSLGCSERTVRRRIDNDPRFPKPIPSSRYEDRGRIRRTQPRWSATDIERYKKLNLP